MHNDLTRGDIATHLRALALPAVTGYFFHTMFNVTDTVFAGEISTQALAALSLTFSIFFMIISVAAGMSEAVTALIGNALGEKDRAQVGRLVVNAFALALLLAGVLTAAGWMVSTHLLGLLGAEGTYLDEALAYIDTVILGILFFVAVFFFNAMLNAVGDTKSFRNFLIAGFFLNVLLDWWFVRGGLGLPPLGIGGIALATVIIEALGALYLLHRLRRTPLLEALHLRDVGRAPLTALIAQGLPPTLNLLLMAMGIFIITFFIAPFGKEVVAAYGVGMRVEQIALMPSIGINIAVLAMVAQNNGAQAYARIEAVITTAYRYGLIVSAVGAALLLGFAETWMGLFSDHAEVITEGARYLRIESLVLFGYMVIFINLALLQGLKRPRMLFYLSLARQIVAPVVLFLALVWLMASLVWYWWSIALIVTVSALFSRWYARGVFRRAQL